jgi:hypothetical protein
VQLDHGVAGSYGFGAIDLNLVVALGAGRGDGCAEYEDGYEIELQERSRNAERIIPQGLKPTVGLSIYVRAKARTLQ